MSPALKAAKVAGLVTLALGSFTAVLVGIVWSIIHFLGPVVYFAFIALFVFTILWVCALLDIREQEKRK